MENLCIICIKLHLAKWGFICYIIDRKRKGESNENLNTQFHKR